MNDKEELLKAIFFLRDSFQHKDERDHLVQVEDDIKIGVRFFISEQTFPTILFFHGNAELSQEYDEIANLYNKNGCNFIVSDYRGYGLSGGIPTKDNLHLDANIIFTYVQNYLKTNEYNNKLVVMGRSLGSASACEIIKNQEQNLNGCIIESGFGTEIPLLKILDLLPEDVDYDPTLGFDNLRKIIDYQKPLFIIHADRDDIIPIDEARNMYNKSKSEKKELWIIPEANHNNILLHTGNEYFKRIKNFIDDI